MLLLSLGSFTQADSIVPAGVQGYDRYAAMNNNPIRYADPTGHMVSDGLVGEGGKCDRKCLDEVVSRKYNFPATPHGGPCVSIVCTRGTVGTVISDPVYPSYQAPSNWTPQSADVSPRADLPTPGVSGFLLFFDLFSSFTYSNKISQWKGSYVIAAVDYKECPEFGITVREPTAIKIFNNSGHPMNVASIRTDYYEMQNSGFSVPNEKGVNLIIDSDKPLIGSDDLL